MTYHDPDSGLDFANEEEYIRARMGEPQPEPTVEEICAAYGHAYEGDDSGRGRCYCGEQSYPEGGPDAEPD